MPILPAEPDLYPADLWERGPLPLPLDEQDEETPRWWCLHTKPRQEKATARYLRSCGQTYYLPQVVQEGRTPQGRKIRSVVPLFPGYVFLHGDQSARLESFRGNTLVQVLPVGDQVRLDGELRQVWRVLASGLPVVVEPSYPVGAAVRITSGPLRGVVGVVARRDKRDRFVAAVQFLGRGASVELQDWQVEPVEETGGAAPTPRGGDARHPRMT